jgi:hypothetical protein
MIQLRNGLLFTKHCSIEQFVFMTLQYQENIMKIKISFIFYFFYRVTHLHR